MFDESANFPSGMEPATVIQAFDAAWNAGDVERVLQFFTPDAVVRFMYPPPFPEPDTYTGREEIRELLRGLFAGRFQMQSADYQVTINQMTWKYRMAAERFRELGVDEVAGSAGATFKEGKIQHLTISFSPDSAASLVAGLDRKGIPGPISEALAQEPEALAGAAQEGEVTGERPNRGPAWEPVGEEDHQPPPPQLS